MLSIQLQRQLNRALALRNQTREISTQNKIKDEYTNVVSLINIELMRYTDLVSNDDTNRIILLALLNSKIKLLISDLYKKINLLLMNDLKNVVNDNYSSVHALSGESSIISDVLLFSLMFNRNVNLSLTNELEFNRDKVLRNISAALQLFDDSNYNIKSIDDIIYHRKDGAFRGDVSNVLRIHRTETTRLRTLSKLEAISNLVKLGYTYKKMWVYTYESKEPRIHHVESNGLFADDRGYFSINGMKTQGPGLFGEASEDINCRCDTDIIIYDQEDNV